MKSEERKRAKADSKLLSSLASSSEQRAVVSNVPAAVSNAPAVVSIIPPVVSTVPAVVSSVAAVVNNVASVESKVPAPEPDVPAAVSDVSAAITNAPTVVVPPAVSNLSRPEAAGVWVRGSSAAPKQVATVSKKTQQSMPSAPPPDPISPENKEMMEKAKTWIDTRLTTKTSEDFDQNRVSMGFNFLALSLICMTENWNRRRKPLNEFVNNFLCEIPTAQDCLPKIQKNVNRFFVYYALMTPFIFALCAGLGGFLLLVSLVTFLVLGWASYIAQVKYGIKSLPLKQTEVPILFVQIGLVVVFTPILFYLGICDVIVSGSVASVLIAVLHAAIHTDAPIESFLVAKEEEIPVD